MNSDIIGLLMLSMFSIWVGFTIGKSVGYNEAKIKNNMRSIEEFRKKSDREIESEKELEEKQKSNL